MAYAPANVLTGPGTVYVAPYGTALPTSASGALDAAFRYLGYTSEGGTFSFEFESAQVEVAESYEPIKTLVTKQAGSFSAELAEMSAANLALALNLGADWSGLGVIEPPTPGSEEYVTIVLQTEQNARWIAKKAQQTGSIEVGFKKSPDKRVIGVEFSFAVPDDASKSWGVYPNASGQI